MIFPKIGVERTEIKPERGICKVGMDKGTEEVEESVGKMMTEDELSRLGFVGFLEEMAPLPDNVFEREKSFSCSTLIYCAQFSASTDEWERLCFSVELTQNLARIVYYSCNGAFGELKKMLLEDKAPGSEKLNKIHDLKTESLDALGALANLVANLSAHHYPLNLFVDVVKFFEPFWTDPAFRLLGTHPFAILVNFTRVARHSTFYVESGAIQLHRISERALGLSEESPLLPYLMEALMNLCQVQEFRRKMYSQANLMSILAMINSNYDPRVRLAVSGIVKNLAFDDDIHALLIDKSSDTFAYALRPIVGTGQYSDDELDSLPALTLSNIILNEEIERDPSVPVRSNALDFLYQLCSKESIRETLRNYNVYCLLREYHKWEQDESLLCKLERIVNILIQTEEEIGATNLKDIQTEEVGEAKSVENSYS